MSYLEQYKKMFPDRDLCYLGDVEGNRVIEEFNYSLERLYKYCVEHRKTWEEVLDFKYDPNAIY